MDEKLGQELAAWLEFYRELGIEDFYQRAPDVSVAQAGAGSGRPTASVVPREGVGQPVSADVPPSGAPQREVSSPESEPTIPTQSIAAVPSPASAATRPSTIQPPAPTLNLFEAPAPQRSGPETLEQVREDLGDCHRCKLAGTRKTIVFGEGHPHAELVFIGEGPGADEDEQGRPFVGRAGQLLNRMIQAIGLKREDVYICNVVKCRPPGNRTPERDEIETCSPFLFRQI